ncbi:MAG TPA: 2-hydroxy-3-oxopropionate reductase [Clostridia bacterium]|nr:2-hydroxy-3-oxopropionate reductase [Clostridia bacterium]
MTIGFIGLGIMGKPMAKNLIRAGHALVVYDLNAKAMEEVCAAGAKPAASVAEVAGQCAVMMTMLPNSPHVRSVCLDKGGIASNAKAGSIVIDMSSISPIVSREIARVLSEKGIDMLDAPVSGGEPKAIDGTLSFMVGGKKETFDQYEPVLSTMGASVVWCGEIGAGNVVKLCNQVVVAANIAAVAEAFMLGKKAGVSPETIYKAIRGGLAGSTVMDAKGPMMLADNFQPGFRIDLHIKDLKNVMDTAKDVAAPMLLTGQTMEMMKNLVAYGEGGLDHSALLKYYERACNEKLNG